MGYAGMIQTRMSSKIEHDRDFWDDVATTEGTTRANILYYITERPYTATQIAEKEENRTGHRPNLRTVAHSLKDMCNHLDVCYTEGKMAELVTSERRRNRMYIATDYGEEVFDNLVHNDFSAEVSALHSFME